MGTQKLGRRLFFKRTAGTLAVLPFVKGFSLDAVASPVKQPNISWEARLFTGVNGSRIGGKKYYLPHPQPTLLVPVHTRRNTVSMLQNYDSLPRAGSQSFSTCQFELYAVNEEKKIAWYQYHSGSIFWEPEQ